MNLHEGLLFLSTAWVGGFWALDPEPPARLTPPFARSWPAVWRSRRARGCALIAIAIMSTAMSMSSDIIPERPRVLIAVVLLVAAMAVFFVERAMFRTRSTYFAVSLASAVCLVDVLSRSFAVASWAASVLAGVFLAQMYLTSAFRKLRSPSFMNGVNVRNFVLATQVQARDGLQRREYLRLLPVGFILRHRESRAWPMMSVVAVVVEFMLGVLAIWPVSAILTLALAVSMHVAFASLMPRRIPAFSIAVMSMWVVALR